MPTLLAKDGDCLSGPSTINKPIAVGKGTFTADKQEVACRIVARYSERDGKIDADISYKRLPESEEKMIKASFPGDEELTRLRTLIPSV